MLRTITVLVALATMAGCIAAPQEPDTDLGPAAAAPEEGRIDGMTAEASHTDQSVDCNDGGLTLPPGFCAERILLVTGRIGLDALPVELIGTNGEISVRTSEGDAWSFTATIRVRALTEEMAREALDTAWTWSHEKDDGTYALTAAPAPGGSVGSLGASVSSTSYALELPTWLALELKALTDNGAIGVHERSLTTAHLETDNGQIVVDGWVRDLRARTDNGQIVATLRPIGSGTIDLSTDNGQVLLKVPEGREHGYNVQAKTQNGQALITLRDCESSQRENAGAASSATCRTSRFGERALRTVATIETINAQAIVSPLD